MESKELFPQTFVKPRLLSLIEIAMVFGGVVSALILDFVFPDTLADIATVCIVGFFGIGLLIYSHIYVNNRTDTVNLFIGDHEYDKFVEISLKYLGYEIKMLEKNGKQERDFIVLNDKHLIYVSKYILELCDIDNACKIAKENNKSLTVIMNDGYITSTARIVVKQNGIIIHDSNDLYNTLYKTIKTKGWEPIRECLCT